MKPWIQSASGVRFDLVNTRPDMVRIEDIAHGLARLCRFTGHTRDHYSVAQHSVIVSYLVPPEDALHGLLHDAPEAYVGDVSSPLKALIGELYKPIEHRVWVCIAARFGISWNLPDSVKREDLRILMSEKRDQLGPSPDEWSVSEEPHDLSIDGWPFEVARAAFLARFEDLYDDRAGCPRTLTGS